MAKRWTWENDLYIASYFDGVGDWSIARDLDRPKGSVAKRVEKLKACGAWDALKAHIKADYETKRSYFVALGDASKVEEIDEFHLGAPDHFAAEIAARA